MEKQTGIDFAKEARERIERIRQAGGSPSQAAAPDNPSVTATPCHLPEGELPHRGKRSWPGPLHKGGNRHGGRSERYHDINGPGGMPGYATTKEVLTCG